MFLHQILSSSIILSVLWFLLSSCSVSACKYSHLPFSNLLQVLGSWCHVLTDTLVYRSLNATWVMAKMRFEDWLMCVTMVSCIDHSYVALLYNLYLTSLQCFYTVLLILINVSARYETNLFPPDQLASIMADPDDVASRIYGSIIVIPLEQCMLASTWCVKICIWLFLWRLW